MSIINIINQSNSGAKIKINNGKKDLFFKKIVDFKNNQRKLRILKQIEKQNKWSKKNIINSFFSIPINYTVFKNKIELNMRFVHGVSGSDILNMNSYKYINSFFESICDLINYFKNTKTSKYIDKELVLEKIYYTKKNSDNNFSNYFKFLENNIDHIPGNLELTDCHGDLTLSNMIIGYNKKNSMIEKDFNNSKIYLVDWLDSDFETYIHDLCKLKQDLYYGWSFRDKNSNEKIYYSITGKFLWEKLEREFINNKNKKIFNFFMKLCILRILPYVKKESDFSWIQSVLDNEYKK
tara:strand:- start:377 stop:1258 length:882 start_codon:yes stop_codon:yes gene_type:complete